MVLSPGDRVDRYEVLGLLGSGGMGQVYRARDPKLARLVALKILQPSSGLGTEGAARLLREARAAAGLAHANVVAVYDVGEVHEPETLRGLAFIAMELVEGRSLRSYLGEAAVPVSRRVGWLRDVASALAAAHRAGIVHRDVKPENVMIRGSDGAVKVLDFGIAKRRVATLDVSSSIDGHSLPTRDPSAFTHTGAGRVVGTPYYMAPEQLRGESLDGRVDQFAWGVMAYQLVTGEGPWTGSDDPLAIISQILSAAPRRPKDIDGRLPERLSSLILRALAKSREDRFDSMDDLLAALDDAESASTERSEAEELPSARPSSSAREAIPSRVSPRPPSSVRSGAARWVLATLCVVLAGAALAAWRVRATQGAAAREGLPVAVGDGAPGCSSNRVCVAAHNGEAWRCSAGRCVELASPDCRVFADETALAADDTVWFGGMFQLSKPPAFTAEMRVADLARQDFATALGPSAARTGRLHARPIGLVACDESADAMRAATHLVQDVEVPGVLGFFDVASAQQTIENVFLPRHVLSFVTLSQAPALTQIPEPPDDPRLVWRATLNRKEAAPPLAHLISDVLEPEARRGSGGLRDRPFKVATLLGKPANPDVINTLFEVLRFNGKSALENGADFRQFTFDTAGNGIAEDVVTSLADFAPNVIVYAGGRSCFSKVIEPLEARWTHRARPYYLTSQGMPEFVRFAAKDATRRHRGFATTAVSTLPTNARLVLRYNMAFPREPVTRSEAPQPSYDAFYVLAYAAYALGEAPVTGPSLARAMARLLPPGKKIDVGPEDILAAFNVLRSDGANAHIDLNGALGSLDFDSESGQAPVDYAITCASVDDHGVTSDTIDSGLWYDSRNGRLVGILHCP